MRNKKICLGNAGAALPLVLCVIAFLIAFSMALTYAASLLLSRTNVKTEEQRCYQLARSFAEQLDAQLTDSTDSSGDGHKGGSVSFKQFVNLFLNSSDYKDYSSDDTDTVYRYAAETGAADADGYGDIEVLLYKEPTGDDGSMSGSFDVVDGVNYEETVKEIQGKPYNRYTVTVEVVAEYDDLTYTYTTEYERTDTYDVQFKNADGEIIVWSSNAWHKHSADGVEWTPSGTISYTYLTSASPKTVTYTPAHAAYAAEP